MADADLELAILKILDDGTSCTSTHWMNAATRRNTAATRRVLLGMARRGLVEPLGAGGKCYRKYWWRITDAGRDVLKKTTEDVNA